MILILINIKTILILLILTDRTELTGYLIRYDYPLNVVFNDYNYSSILPFIINAI